MKRFLIPAAALLLFAMGVVAGVRVGQKRAALKSRPRYELHPAGIPGCTIRLDKVSGETLLLTPQTMERAPARIDFEPEPKTWPGKELSPPPR